MRFLSASRPYSRLIYRERQLKSRASSPASSQRHSGLTPFSTGLTRSGFSSTHAAPATAYSRPTNKSSDRRVAFPLDPGHLARENINIERAVMPDATFLSLLGYGVMSGRKGNPKPSLIISRERCDRALFVFYDESSIRERRRTGNAGSDRPALSWTKRNYSFDPCSWLRLRLPRGKG